MKWAELTAVKRDLWGKLMDARKAGKWVDSLGFRLVGSKVAESDRKMGDQ